MLEADASAPAGGGDGDNDAGTLSSLLSLWSISRRMFPRAVSTASAQLTYNMCRIGSFAEYQNRGAPGGKGRTLDGFRITRKKSRTQGQHHGYAAHSPSTSCPNVKMNRAPRTVGQSGTTISDPAMVDYCGFESQYFSSFVPLLKPWGRGSKVRFDESGRCAEVRIPSAIRECRASPGGRPADPSRLRPRSEGGESFKVE